MNLKEFFKPNLKKILLWIILLLIIPIPGFYFMYFPKGSIGTEPRSTPLVYPMPNIILLLFSPSNLVANLIERPYIFVIFLIALYIISCLVFWVYNRVKKK